ncbi:MAG: site-specific integrase [Rickettsiaceae bacterium]|nr:site-specific integrase [Rickettsiaceae bacterium]
MNKNSRYIPKPVFDTLGEITQQYKTIQSDETPRKIIKDWLEQCFTNSNVNIPSCAINDYKFALGFLYSYRGSHDTFSSYRRDIERFLQWSWFIKEQSVLKHKRDDIESFIEFCIKPYKSWIGHKTVARFKNIEGVRLANPEWRPFDVYISKTDHKKAIKTDKNNYKFSQQALKVMFGILSSFYNYLLQEDATNMNPVALIRQKSKFIRNEQELNTIRRLSDEQWQTVMNLARQKATEDKENERGIFILSCLYGMYLRISELVASERWVPTMGDFFKDQDENWWFKTVSKGNKARKIAVSDAMLKALKQYRVNYLELSPYPLPGEKTPLISHIKNRNSSLKSDRPIRRLVQRYFDLAADYLEAHNKTHEAASLRTATVHWLRHTGISDDVKIRPREHVRDDAGHSSGAITDRYIDVELMERAKSAKRKVIAEDK